MGKDGLVMRVKPSNVSNAARNFSPSGAKSLKRSATFATGTSESHPRTMIADPQPGAMRRKDNI